MCGICGIYNFDGTEINLKLLKIINENLYKRGPDSGGIYNNKSIGLGNRRLKIIDFLGGEQPFESEDKNIILVFNGEIYNYIELREDLIKEGYKFKTESDTEVVLKCYQAYGKKMLNKLNGMFAFSIWDRNKKKLFIARDRLGVKPLYFYYDKKNLIFSSTLNSIVKNTDIEKIIDSESLIYYSFLGYIPSPKTIWKNFHKLEPGSYIEIENNKFSITKYWELKININEKINEKNVQTHTDELENIILDSNEIQSRSDANIGVFLSGGLDSSFITKILTLNYKKTFNTYTVDFEGKKIKEIENVKNFSKDLNTRINYEIINFEDNKKIFYEVIKSLDEPNSDSASIPSYLLAKNSKKNNDKVILNGCGGDEIFGGYDRHYIKNRFIIGNFISKIKKKINVKGNLFYFNKNLLHYEIKLTDPIIRFVSNSSGTNLGFLSKTLKNNFFEKGCELINKKFIDYNFNYEKYGPVYAGMFQDLKYYVPDNLLFIADQTSMDNSVEVRVPFLDHRIIEKIFSFPKKLIISKSFKNSKRLLRQILKKYISLESLNTKKVGFNVPSNQWVKKEYEYFKNFILNENKSEIWGVFDFNEIKKILESKKLINKYSNDIFMIYTLIKWYQFHGKN